MAKQHRYTAPENITVDVGRLASINIHFNSRVDLTYILGVESGGIFTEESRVIRSIAWANVPAGVQTTLDELETKGLTYGVTEGVLAAGAEEIV